MKRKLLLYLVMSLMLTISSACSTENDNEIIITYEEETSEQINDSGISENVLKSAYDDGFYNELVPVYGGEEYVIINENVPFFKEYTTESFEYYSELDDLGRCGYAFANVGIELMPTEERGEIGSIKPSGWQTIKYDFVDGKYLYNRCHLLGFQLTGENANECNLITGTRNFNTKGMLPFENMIADYIDKTNYHVMYRVTPVFKADNLVSDGVLMEAYSIEDYGDGISFCVFAYNAEPGVIINYVDGSSYLNDYPVEIVDAADENDEITESNVEKDFVLNLNTKRYHLPDCSSVSDILSLNKANYYGTEDELIQNGFKGCGNCMK